MAADSDGEPHLGCATRLPYLGYKLGVIGGSKVRQLPGVCEEDNDLIQTVFTCHGNLDDPDFPQRFTHLLGQLSKILSTGEDVLMQRVKKIEPWNSVRVTLTIPREAASRLRALAAAGDAALQALGILSVQLEGDQVISLRLANQFGGEPQEIVLRTSASNETAAVSSPVVENASTSIPAGPVTTLLQSIPGPSGASNNGFRSPNVVAPAASAVIPPSPRPHSGPSPFPFTSMTHAAQTQQSRQDSPHHTFTPPPPPYAARSFTPPLTRPSQAPLTPSPAAAVPALASSKPIPTVDTTVSLASPLLVNLLQTDGKDSSSQGTEARPRPVTSAPSKPRPRPLTKTLSQRAMPPRFPAAVAAATVQRFPPATAVSVNTASTTTTTSPRPLRPTLTTTPSQPRSVLLGYSQFTALSSKPCSLTESKEASEEKNNTADGKKLIINPLTGEMEPMISESSDSDDGLFDSLVGNSTSPKNSLSDEDIVTNRFSDTSDEPEMPSKPNGPDVRRRPTMHKPGTVATVPTNPNHAPEKIKLIKIKPEPGSAPASAYKVESFASDVSRKSVASPGGRSASLPSPVSSTAVIPVATTATPLNAGTPTAEEPRVPPLHISLRGRNATVVSSKKKGSHWLSDDDETYSKLPKKKAKLGSGSMKDGRDCIAINNSDLTQTQKPKRAKMKRILGTVDEGLKLKIPVMADLDIGDLCDEKLNKKRKDSKKLKNTMRHSDSDGDTKVSLKVDSKEWISRTLKEETLRHGVSSIPGELVDGQVAESESGDSQVSVSACADSDGVVAFENDSALTSTLNMNNDTEPTSQQQQQTTTAAAAASTTTSTSTATIGDTVRTSSPLKSGNLELSELLRCKKMDGSNNKKLDCLKINKSKMFAADNAQEENEEDDASASEVASVKKPQEIGGKIKSELSSKIDRVSGKLKSDLSKDGINKKKLDEVVGKGLKTNTRTKCVKKDGVTARLVVALSAEPETDEMAFNRAKRRHSGDQSVPESQAQKVKRSSSSDQPSPITKLPLANRKFVPLTRKIRKDYVIDRLRKDKLGKVAPVNAKLNNPAADGNNKKIHNRSVGNNGAVKSGVDVTTTAQALTVLPPLVDVKPVLTRLEADPDKLKDSAVVEGNTQGEDSGIESMDALSEKSPNQGESPCRKEDSKEMDEGKKGQNHDRTDEDDGKELNDNSCLTIGNSNQDAHQPQAHSVPFDCSSQNNNNPAEPEPETSTKLSETADDGLIDSFGIKIREAFRRDEDPSREGLGAKILEGSSKEWGKKPKTEKNDDSNNKDTKEPSLVDGVDDKVCPSTDSKEWQKDGSPSLEDMERFRVNPPLYTYAKREDSLSPSPTTVEGSDQRNHSKEEETGSSSKSGNSTQTPSKTEDATDDTSASPPTPGRALRNKSLLEQLLIEIPEDSRRTRSSWHKLGNSPGETPKSSPRANSPTIARPSPRSTTKQSPTPRTSKRPNKRKCSENAAELIKACMGVDDGKSGKIVNNATTAQWKKADVESSDDEPLSDLARSREHSVEQDTKPNALRTKLRQMVEEESRNNNKVSVKVVTDPPTRRSVRQTQGSLNKTLRPVAASDGRSVRSTRSAPCQETGETGNKRRRASRDGK